MNGHARPPADSPELIYDLAIVGAGPIGLEAAVLADHHGLRAVVFESANIGEHIRRWQHVRMFTPFEMNSSHRGRQRLASAGLSLPESSATQTGGELVEGYLRPLASTLGRNVQVKTHCRVTDIGRRRYWKGDAIGQDERADDPFQLLTNGRSGAQRWLARRVLDCSGVLENPNRVGAGGIEALGETVCLRARDYCIPDPLGSERGRFAGRRTLVVGSGYSAATTVCQLAALAEDVPQTNVVWRTRRTTDTPLKRIADDSLSHRDELCRDANRLAMDTQVVDWQPGWIVDRISRSTTGRLIVNLIAADPRKEGTEELQVDHVIANVGYGPDRSLYRELQVHECYATCGPIKLAASLLGQSGGDCLATGHGGPELLRNPEPGFFILGAKSYGRDPRFLLQTGLRQVEELFAGSLMPATGQGGCT